MPLRPRFGPLGVSDVVGCAPLLEPAGSNPGGVVAVRDTAARPNRLATSPHRRDDTSPPTRPGGFCVRAICAARASQGANVTGASHLLLANSRTDDRMPRRSRRSALGRRDRLSALCATSGTDARAALDGISSSRPRALPTRSEAPVLAQCLRAADSGARAGAPADTLQITQQPELSGKSRGFL